MADYRPDELPTVPSLQTPNGDYGSGKGGCLQVAIICGVAMGIIIIADTIHEYLPSVLDYMSDTVIHQNNAPVIKFHAELVARGKEMQEHIFAKPLIQFGFKCTDNECAGTANGIQIVGYDNSTPQSYQTVPWQRHGREYMEGIDYSYRFTSSQYPDFELSIGLTVSFAQTPRYLRMGFDISEVISTSIQYAYYKTNYYHINGVRSGADREMTSRPSKDIEQLSSETFAPLTRSIGLIIPSTSSLCSSYRITVTHKSTDRYDPLPIVTHETSLREILASNELANAGCWENTPQRSTFTVRPAMANGQLIKSKDWLFPLSIFN